MVAGSPDMASSDIYTLYKYLVLLYLCGNSSHSSNYKTIENLYKIITINNFKKNIF